MRSKLLITLAVSLVVIAAAFPAFAQEKSTGFLAADEEMVGKLLKGRSTDELTRELEGASERATAAEQELREAADIAAVARARVTIKKEELSLVKERITLARSERNATKRSELDALRGRQEEELGVFEIMREAADVQKERAEAALDFARSRMRMHEIEIKLAQKRETRIALAGTQGDAVAAAKLAEMDTDIRNSSRAVLNAMRDYAKKSRRLADTTEDLAKARLELLDAWEARKGR